MAYTTVVKDGQTYYRSDQGLYSREPPVAAPGERPTLPTFAAPEYPTYTPAAREPGRVEELTQQIAAPGVRGLRTQVQRAIGRRYVNPQVARMTLREALAGYGAGLESVMGGARRGALGQYETEYAPKAEKARMEYQTGVSQAQAAYQARIQAQMTEYQTAWKDYMAGQPYGAIQAKRTIGVYGGIR